MHLGIYKVMFVQKYFQRPTLHLIIYVKKDLHFNPDYVISTQVTFFTQNTLRKMYFSIGVAFAVKKHNAALPLEIVLSCLE